MKIIKIGKISGAQGLRGEVKLYHDSGDEEALRRLSSIFVGKRPEDLSEDRPEDLSEDRPEDLSEDLSEGKPESKPGDMPDCINNTGGTELIGMRIESMRMHRRTPILALEGITDRNQAEALIGATVYADENESRPDEEGVYLVSELVGLEVRLLSAKPAGTVKNIISNPAHDILEIETDQVVRLLPFIDVFVKLVDIKQGVIIIEPPEDWMRLS